MRLIRYSFPLCSPLKIFYELICHCIIEGKACESEYCASFSFIFPFTNLSITITIVNINFLSNHSSSSHKRICKCRFPMINVCKHSHVTDIMLAVHNPTKICNSNLCLLLYFVLHVLLHLSLCLIYCLLHKEAANCCVVGFQSTSFGA